MACPLGMDLLEGRAAPAAPQHHRLERPRRLTPVRLGSTGLRSHIFLYHSFSAIRSGLRPTIHRTRAAASWCSVARCSVDIACADETNAQAVGSVSVAGNGSAFRQCRMLQHWRKPTKMLS